MKTAQKTAPINQEPIDISRKKLASFVSEMIGGTPDPDNPPKPGPWDPVIRKAVNRLSLFAYLRPEIWDAIGPQLQPWARVALNPQPLPPRARFAVAFAQEAIDRAVLKQEIADALPRQAEQKGIIIVGGYVSDMVDFVCGSEVRHKFPFPPPKNDRGGKLSGHELILMGSVYEQNVATTANAQLQQEFRNAGARLTEQGFARM